MHADGDAELPRLGHVLIDRPRGGALLGNLNHARAGHLLGDALVLGADGLALLRFMHADGDADLPRLRNGFIDRPRRRALFRLAANDTDRHSPLLRLHFGDGALADALDAVTDRAGHFDVAHHGHRFGNALLNCAHVGDTLAAGVGVAALVRVGRSHHAREWHASLDFADLPLVSRLLHHLLDGARHVFKVAELDRAAHRHHFRDGAHFLEGLRHHDGVGVFLFFGHTLILRDGALLLPRHRHHDRIGVLLLARHRFPHGLGVFLFAGHHDGVGVFLFFGHTLILRDGALLLPRHRHHDGVGVLLLAMDRLPLGLGVFLLPWHQDGVGVFLLLGHTLVLSDGAFLLAGHRHHDGVRVFLFARHRFPDRLGVLLFTRHHDGVGVFLLSGHALVLGD